MFCPYLFTAFIISITCLLPASFFPVFLILFLHFLLHQHSTLASSRCAAFPSLQMFFFYLSPTLSSFPILLIFFSILRPLSAPYSPHTGKYSAKPRCIAVLFFITCITSLISTFVLWSYFLSLLLLQHMIIRPLCNTYYFPLLFSSPTCVFYSITYFLLSLSSQSSYFTPPK